MKYVLSFIVFLITPLLLAGFSFAVEMRVVPTTQQQLQYSYAPIVKQVTPAVVNIYTRRVVRQQATLFNDPFIQNFFGNSMLPYRDRVENSLGSGVIVDNDGLVMTNNHVIAEAADIKVVTAEGSEFAAKILYRDEKRDLAVLKLEGAGQHLPFLPFGDADTVQVGDVVLAIGNPFGVGQTVTSGIVSGLARTTVGISDYQFFIQTDAAINPGNSGGALVDMQGKLIGIPTAIFSRSGGSNGIGFAIPATMVEAVLQTAKKGGIANRAWLGATGQTVTFELAQSLGLDKAGGVLVNKVSPKSPAGYVDIREGDVLLSLNGHVLHDVDTLKFRLATLSAGDVVKIHVLRARTAQTIQVALAKLPEMPPRDETVLEGDQPLTGLRVININPAVAEEFNLGEESVGVIVTGVVDNSFVARFGLRMGDRVLSINSEKVVSVKQLQKLLRSKARRWVIAVQRGQQVLQIRIN
jgi:Do/DeqQ family serine protease